jgi:Fe-S cluster biogenesis protein NfuA/nitrite reductase/ring-hydroxylating ferredoxin subunit
MDDTTAREEAAALEELLAHLEQMPDGEERAAAVAAVEGLLRVYGEALRRVVDAVSIAPQVVDALAADELVSHLLMLHGLHPSTVEERVVRALEEVRPYMGSHGGGIELVEVRDGVARVRLEGTCHGCGASTVTLKLAVEEAVLRAAPELTAVEAIEAEAQPSPVPLGVALPMHDGGFPLVASPGRWIDAGAVGDLVGTGQPLRRSVEGAPLLFVGLDENVYAYADRCPGCSGALERPTLVDGALVCAGCGRRYDVRAAGQCLDGGLLQLDPIPLLVGDGGRVRVALAGAVA